MKIFEIHIFQTYTIRKNPGCYRFGGEERLAVQRCAVERQHTVSSPRGRMREGVGVCGACRGLGHLGWARGTARCRVGGAARARVAWGRQRGAAAVAWPPGSPWGVGPLGQGMEERAHASGSTGHQCMGERHARRRRDVAARARGRA
jgi:hypothetical protein